MADREVNWYALGSLPGGVTALGFSYLVFYLIWAPPSGLELTALIAWLLALHLVGRVTSTLYTVPYLALGAEISKDYEERTRLATARSVYFHAGRATAGGLLLLVFLSPTEACPEGFTGLGPLGAGIVVDLVGLSGDVSPEVIPEAVATGLGLA